MGDVHLALGPLVRHLAPQREDAVAKVDKQPLCIHSGHVRHERDLVRGLEDVDRRHEGGTGARLLGKRRISLIHVLNLVRFLRHQTPPGRAGQAVCTATCLALAFSAIGSVMVRIPSA